MYRQGDVFIRAAEVPRKATEVPRDGGRLVLAYGEVTGHAHVVDAPPEEATLLTDEQERRFLRLVTAAPLVHEEHGTITLPPGTYEVRRQREYTAADMPARQVLD
jgi:hypothetical protein